MKNFQWWAVAGVAGLGAALSGCGSGSSGSSTVSLRLANATLTHPTLDLLVNSTVSLSATATATDTVSAYVAPAAGGNTLQVDDAGSATALTTTVPTLTGGQHYTLLAYESGGTVKTVVLSEDDALPAAGVAQLRIFDTALEAGKLDVYITAPGADLSVLSPTTSFGTLTAPAATQLQSYSAGTYEVRVTGAGNKSDLRLDMPVTLTSQQIASVVLTPAVGGALLNGSSVIEQGTYAATRNTNVRVRLASAVSGVNTTVAASATTPAGTTTIDAGSVAPAFGYYVLVPASSTLNINVNSQSIPAPATALAAGTDATLLVYGAPGTATAKLIADDNRPPTDPTTVKLRLINGITGNPGALTLTANTSPVGVGILPGAASSYVSVLGSTNAMNLTLTSSTAGAYLPNTSNILNPGSVYSVMAADPATGATQPQLLIR